MEEEKMAVRQIVHIDEDKCNGCGLCVPNCAEGAIQIIDGKAKLLAENLCDGLESSYHGTRCAAPTKFKPQGNQEED